MNRVARIGAVALAFAVCGGISSYIYDANSIRGWLLFPLPFALLARLLFLRKSMIIEVAAVIVWNIAYWSTYFLYTDARAALAFGLGGLIGGLGLSAAAAPNIDFLLVRRWLAIGAAIGCVAAMVFLLDFNGNGPPTIAFAVWQGAMGAFLCWCSLQTTTTL